MQDRKDYLGDKLRLVERAREDAYFRQLDEELMAKMRQQAAQEQAIKEAEVPEDTPLPDCVFTSILVPVDFSSHSTRALLTAAQLAKQFGASLIVLHVIDRDIELQLIKNRFGYAGLFLPDPHVGDHSDISNDEIETMIIDRREQTYEALQTFLPPQLAHLSVEIRVVVGRPFERIVEMAVDEKTSLIVIGTHGRTGLAHLALGSIAERVVRLAPCPVLTVKEPSPEAESWLTDFYNTFLQTHP